MEIKWIFELDFDKVLYITWYTGKYLPTIFWDEKNPDL